MEEYINLLTSLFDIPEAVLNMIRSRYEEIEENSHFVGTLQTIISDKYKDWKGAVTFIRDIPISPTSNFGDYIVMNKTGNIMNVTVPEKFILFKVC